MGNKVIFELKLNETDSIIAYEKRNYETCYEDSLLYLNVGGKKIKTAENSFCYGFGAEMYYRVYNIKSFDETVSFIDILKRFYNSIIYNDDYDPNDSKSRSYYTSVDFDEKDYCFANGKVSDNKFTPLFLYKNESGYKVLLVELWEDKTTKKTQTKLMYEFLIREENFLEWKKYFEYMRSDS